MFCCTGFVSTTPLHLGEVIYFLSTEEVLSAVPSRGFEPDAKTLPLRGATRCGTGWGHVVLQPQGQAWGGQEESVFWCGNR